MDKRASLNDSFKMADEVLRQGIQGISELITVPGLINLDFADVRAIMSEGGAALMAVGKASGEDRARLAAEQAISSQLLDITIDGARGVLFNVTGGPNLTLFEVNQAAALIRETSHPDVNMIFGAVIDPNMSDEIRVTVIATGFERTGMPRRIAPPPPTMDGKLSTTRWRASAWMIDRAIWPSSGRRPSIPKIWTSRPSCATASNIHPPKCALVSSSWSPSSSNSIPPVGEE